MMDAPCNALSGDDGNRAMKALLQRAIAESIPINGSIELTFRCPMKCIHCYVAGPHSERELTAEQWFRIVNQLADAGCLFLLITGGDPVSHPNFASIYERIRSRGIFVTLFLSGYSVPDHVLDCIASFPPRKIEITIYGASNQTYRRVSGIARGFDRVVRTIESILSRKLPLGLKAVLLRENVDDWPGILALAEKYGLSLRTDAVLFPRFDGDRLPLESRISPEQAVRIESSCPNFKEKWTSWLSRSEFMLKGYPEGSLYVCGAGRTDFFITSSGLLTPCLTSRDPGYDLTTGDFSEGWSVIKRVRERKAPNGFVCNSCQCRQYCMCCPPLMTALTGSEVVPEKYVCELARKRYSTFGVLKGSEV